MATLKLSNRARNALSHTLFGTAVDSGREITTEDLAQTDCYKLIRMHGLGRLSFDEILTALREAGAHLACGCPGRRRQSNCFRFLQCRSKHHGFRCRRREGHDEKHELLLQWD